MDEEQLCDKLRIELDNISESSLIELSDWLLERPEVDHISSSLLQELLLNRYIRYSLDGLNETLRDQLADYITTHAHRNIYDNHINFFHCANRVNEDTVDSGALQVTIANIRIEDLDELHKFIDMHAKLYALRWVKDTIGRGINRVRTITNPNSLHGQSSYNKMKSICESMCQSVTESVEVQDILDRYIDVFKKVYNTEWKKLKA